MYRRNTSPFLFSMLSVFLCGCLLFLSGFFPDAHVKNEVGNNELGSLRPTDVKGSRISPPEPKYSQSILMIVDALRFDFVQPSDQMPFVHTQRCNRLKLRVAIPTVTMPRIKSLMTGTISNFIDIIRNLGETEQLSDSILHVLRKHNRSINFVGDRTWTQLFPTEFTRKRANMDSFFVHDFYEGDRQVVETMRKEIDEMDWSFLILHFLGLDHIGHVEGSNSPKIIEKLKEMDNVISDICTHKFFENRLLLVTGDHGMREGGGHGGSTEEELTVPLLVFNKNCNKNDDAAKTYNQIDLTPTLAILMSIEIPQPSIGCLIPELLQNFSQEERLYAYFYNAQHLIHKAKMKYGESNIAHSGYLDWFELAQVAHKDFIERRLGGMPGSFYYEQALKNYQRIANEISKRMSESLVAFDYGLIGVGLLLTTSAVVYTLICVLFAENQQHRRNNSKAAMMFTVFLWIISFAIALILNISSQKLDMIVVNSFKRNCLFTAAICIGVFISLNILREIQKLVLPLPSAAQPKLVFSFPFPLLGAFLLTVSLLASSSYIEYEHRTWHYLGVTCMFWLVAKYTRQEFPKFSDDYKSGHTLFISLLKKWKSEIVLNFALFCVLRFLSALNTASNRRWASWIQVFRQFSLSLLFIGSLVFLFQRLRKFLTPKQRKPCIAAVLCIVFFQGFQGKISFFPHIKFCAFSALCLFWVFIILMGFVNYAAILSNNGKMFGLLQYFLVCSMLVAALLHQTHNVILLPCLLCILELAYHICDNLKLKMREPFKQRYKLACKTFLTIFIANMFFFYQGNSNSLATIDLNPGYIGQSTYNPVIVAIFVTLNTYSAPINAFYYFVLHVLTNENKDRLDISASKNYSGSENLPLVMSLYTVATLLPVAVYLGLMILFRYHLFIYSVFAPKVFYECFSVLVFLLIYSGFYLLAFILK